MSADLQVRLSEARAAASLLAEQRALQEMADELPALERQARKERAFALAQARKEQEGEAARRTLVDSKPKIEAWRARMAAALVELASLAQELPEIEAPILAAGQALRRVCDAVLPFELQRDADGLPLQGMSDGGLGEAWEAAGGYDPALDPLPDDPRLAKVLEIFRGRFTTPVYRPGPGGVRLFSR